MVLFYPPVSKPSEPPPGLARLAGALTAHSIPHTIVDANIEGILHVLDLPSESNDTWTKRAYRQRSKDISAIRNRTVYSHPDMYKTKIRNINRLLQAHSSIRGQIVSLTDYSISGMSPLESRDLVRAFENPHESIFHNYYMVRCSGLFDKTNIDFAGISLCFLSQVLPAFALAAVIRRLVPDCRLILGGSLLDAWNDIPAFKTVSRQIFDHVITGPGEEHVLSILGKKAEQSIQYKPSFDQFTMESYFSPGPIIPYNTSFGCYWNKCTFCPENAVRNAYRPVKHADAIDHIRSLDACHTPVLFHLTDSAISPAFLRQAGESHMETPWYGFVRVEPHLEDPEFVRRLKSSGCVMLELGIESGNEEVLGSINKGITLKSVRRVLRNLKDAGIAVYGYVLFGVPEEDRESAEDTVRFLSENAHLIDFLNVSIFNMPVAGIGSNSHPTHEFYSGDLALYTDFDHPKGWDRRAVRTFIDTVVRKNRAIAPLVAAKPASFTSNHAPLFIMQL